jgi:hypothetical protein
MHNPWKFHQNQSTFRIKICQNLPISQILTLKLMSICTWNISKWIFWKYIKMHQQLLKYKEFPHEREWKINQNENSRSDLYLNPGTSIWNEVRIMLHHLVYEILSAQICKFLEKLKEVKISTLFSCVLWNSIQILVFSSDFQSSLQIYTILIS